MCQKKLMWKTCFKNSFFRRRRKKIFSVFVHDQRNRVRAFGTPRIALRRNQDADENTASTNLVGVIPPAL